MRLVVISDIHGNYAALEAVLKDIATQGEPDFYWVLGDLVAFGHDPVACLQAVRHLPEDKTKVIRGNTDRELIRGQRSKLPRPTEENWQQFPAMVEGRNQNYQWTLEKLSWEDAEYLLKLKTEMAMEVAGYGWVIGFHAIPGDDEQILLPDTPASDVLDALMDREGRLAFGGHTHRPMDRDLGDWRMVNPGSVGLPLDGDQRASYASVTFSGGTATVDIRRVEYDVQAVIADLEAKQHPAKDWIITRLEKAGV